MSHKDMIMVTKYIGIYWKMSHPGGTKSQGPSYYISTSRQLMDILLSSEIRLGLVYIEIQYTNGWWILASTTKLIFSVEDWIKIEEYRLNDDEYIDELAESVWRLTDSVE